MLSRYRMARGVPASRLPRGMRQDTRKHTHHILRPAADLVLRYFETPTGATWRAAMKEYCAELERRFREDHAVRCPGGAGAQRGRVARLQLPDEAQPGRPPLPHLGRIEVHAREISGSRRTHAGRGRGRALSFTTAHDNAALGLAPTANENVYFQVFLFQRVLGRDIDA